MQLILRILWLELAVCGSEIERNVIQDMSRSQMKCQFRPIFQSQYTEP
jgi:hypothetical protein